VSGLKDLIITTTESMDLTLLDDETTKYDKQERFKRQHRSATPCPEGIPDNLTNGINELRRRLNLLRITFASLEDNKDIKAEKYVMYLALLDQITQTLPSTEEGIQNLSLDEEDWVTQAIAASELPARKRKADKISHAPQDYYWMDPRNLNHAKFS
jgi:hypothetical protein